MLLVSDGAGNASTDYADGAVSLCLIILIRVVEGPKLLPWAPFCLDKVWSSFIMCAGKFEHSIVGQLGIVLNLFD